MLKDCRQRGGNEMASAQSLFYNAEAVQRICECGRTKAYEIIRGLGDDLEKQGYMRPPNGKIQKTLFCDRLKLDLAQCENILQERVRT